MIIFGIYILEIIYCGFKKLINNLENHLNDMQFSKSQNIYIFRQKSWFWKSLICPPIAPEVHKTNLFVIMDHKVKELQCGNI